MPTLRNLPRTAPATTAIAAICTLVFFVAALQARSLTDVVWDSAVGSSTILYGPEVYGAGYLRALTAGFMHLDITHLFLNMFMLVLVGAEVERFLGSGPFVVAWVAGVLWASASVLAFSFTTPTAGASGALYMLMALLIAIAFRRSTDLRAPLALVAVNVAYTLLSPGVSLWGAPRRLGGGGGDGVAVDVAKCAHPLDHSGRRACRCVCRDLGADHPVDAAVSCEWSAPNIGWRSRFPWHPSGSY